MVPSAALVAMGHHNCYQDLHKCWPGLPRRGHGRMRGRATHKAQFCRRLPTLVKQGENRSLPRKAGRTAHIHSVMLPNLLASP